MAPSPRILGLLSVMCESLLVGGYAVLVCFIIWLLSTSPRSTARTILFGASIVMFLLSAVHLGLVVQQYSAPDNLTVANFKTQIVLTTLQFVIGNLVLIWRVWVIWDYNYWAATGPLIVMIIAAGLSLNLVSRFRKHSFFTVTPSAMLVANTSICTLMIVGRVWYVHYNMRKSIGNFGIFETWQSYKKGLLLVIESGVLYTATQIMSLTLYYLRSEGLSVMLNLDVPLIGILPTLITVLVHFDMVTRPLVNTNTSDHSIYFRNKSLRESISSGSTTPVDNTVILDSTLTLEDRELGSDCTKPAGDDAV